MNNLSIKIKQIDPLELKNFEIEDVSKIDGNGRRFILKSTKSSTKELKLKSIYKRLEKLSRLKNQNPEEKLVKLNALKDFIKVIRDADHLAEAALNKRHTYYKIVTWFLRIFSFGSHTKNLDHFDKSIQKKINKTNAEILEIDGLIQAVKDGNVNYIKHLISKGMNLDVQNKMGETPLHLAIARADSELFDLIIDSGVNVNITLSNKINITNYLQNSPLIYAIMLGKEDFAKKLIKKGADVNFRNRSAETPLIYATRKNQINIVKKLIKKGAHVNHQNNSGESSLICGARCGTSIEIIKQLINSGADLNLADISGKTAFMKAEASGSIEILNLLINAGGNFDEMSGRTALFLALETENIDIAENIINKGFNLNYQDSDGKTALIDAIIWGRFKSVNFLINKGVDIDLADKEGRTALIQAIIRKENEIVNLLIDNGADPNLPNKDGATPLIYSVYKSSTDIIKNLVEKGANPNLQMRTGTPLVIAKFLEKKEIADILIASLTNEEFIAQKEMFNIKLLGHGINGAGTIIVKVKESNQTYDAFLEGSTGSYFWKNITKVNQAFSKKYPKLMSDQEALHFKNLIQKNSLEEINNGIILDTGYKEHAVKVLILGPFFFLINRGGTSQKPVEVFRYDQQKMNQQILNKIENQQNNDEDSYNELFSVKTLGFKSKGNFELGMEKFCSKFLPMQTVGNCNWASSEGAMFVFFLSNVLFANDQGEYDFQVLPSKISASQVEAISNKFYAWLSFVQTYNLGRYLGTDVLRANPNKADRRKEARKAIDINYPLLFFSIKTIKANALKTNDPNKALDILKDVLAEALVTIKGDPQSTITANEIVNNIETMNSSNLQSKFAF